MLERIFKAFRAERGHENGKPLAMLQDQLAEHAPELISHGFIDLKTLIATIQQLESARGGDDSGVSNERKLQAFLRGEDPAAEPETEGTVQ